MTLRLRASCRPVALLAIAVLAASCSAPAKLRSVHADIEAMRKQIAPVPADPDLVQVRCAFHVHSKYSHDSKGSIESIVRAARANGIEAVFLTDHTNPRIFTDCPEGRMDGVLLVRGEEVSLHRSMHGSLLALGTHRSIDSREKTGQQIVDEIVEQGGVCCVSHLEATDPFSIAGYAAVGIHNLHADANRIPRVLYPWIYLDFLFYRHSFAHELLLRHLIQVPVKQLHTWDELLKTRRVTAIGEADAHDNVRVLGLQFDPYALILGVESTYLLVPPVWDKEDLLEAVRAGRSFVGLTMLADPRGFSFEVERDGHVLGRIGDEARSERDLVLHVRSPGIGRIRIVHDGKAIAWGRGRELEAPCAVPGAYRAEVWVEIGGRSLPWILSSPIYVRGNPSESDAVTPAQDLAAGPDDER